MTGNGGDNILNGYDGNDTLVGGLGADTLIGGNGIDLVNYSASSSAVNVNLATGIGSGGHAQGDTYNGVENITGSAFNDLLTGNGARNVLRGGGGNDMFVFTPAGGADTILDFADDVDTLDLSAFGFANVAAALSFATDLGADILFDFAPGNTLLMAGLGNIADLNNDLIV